MSDRAQAGLLTAYVNFLLDTGQIGEAYGCLLQTIASENAESELGYGLMEQISVSPVLQERIDRDKPVQVRGMDYAFYLLIPHYEAFQLWFVR